MQKKLDWLKIWLIVKNQQFLSNQVDIPPTSSTHELVILTKFHKDWQEIVDFLVIPNFEPVQLFLHQSLVASLESTLVGVPYHLQSTLPPRTEGSDGFFSYSGNKVDWTVNTLFFFYLVYPR